MATSVYDEACAKLFGASRKLRASQPGALKRFNDWNMEETGHLQTLNMPTSMFNDIYAEVRAGYWFLESSGSVTIAAIGLSGELRARFENQTNVSGNLNGYINILDLIEESFSMSFNTTF